MDLLLKTKIIGRQRACLERARASGYLNAISRSGGGILRRYGLWCWTLRIPLIWYERKSPRSRCARIHLELFTTANALTEQGQAELAGIGRQHGLRGSVTLSPAGGIWEDVPTDRAGELSRRILKLATRPGNYELLEPGPSLKPASRWAPASNVVAWPRSA